MMSRSKSVRRPVVLLKDSRPVKPSQWDWKTKYLHILPSMSSNYPCFQNLVLLHTYFLTPIYSTHLPIYLYIIFWLYRSYMFQKLERARYVNNSKKQQTGERCLSPINRTHYNILWRSRKANSHPRRHEPKVQTQITQAAFSFLITFYISLPPTHFPFRLWS